METIITLSAIGLVAVASWLALKAYKKVGKVDLSDNEYSEFGEAAIQLLRDMRNAEKIQERCKRIPKTIELIEERNRLLDCIDNKNRQQLISECTDNCA